jgi:hypothetical protein
MAEVTFGEAGFGQATGGAINPSKEVLDLLPKGALEDEVTAELYGLASGAFGASNIVPGLGTVGGAIVALGLLVGPKVFKGLKDFFGGKKNPWVKRVRKIRNSSADPFTKWQAAWALKQVAFLEARALRAARRQGGAGVRIATDDAFRWAEGAITSANNLANEIFPTIPAAQRRQAEPLVINKPQSAQFLRGFPIKIDEINKLTDEDVKLWISAMDSRLRILREWQAKGVADTQFTSDQLMRYRNVYVGVLQARDRARAEIAARAAQDAANRRALNNFLAFLRQLEVQINAINPQDFKTPKQIEDTLAIAGAARQQAVAINAVSVVRAIDSKTAELQARLKQIKTRRNVGTAATVAAVAAAASRLL